jgi:rfaE bifunctional protein kinase chain/domain
MIEKLERYIKEVSQKKILVLGDIILDLFSWGEIIGLNPEQPAAPKVRMIKNTYALGGAANVANNVKALGINCSLGGILKRADFNSARIVDMCKQAGISTDYIFSSENAPLILKQRIMAHNQQITRLDWGEEKPYKLEKSLENKLINLFKEKIKEDNFDLVILSDYNKGFFTKLLVQNIIQTCKAYDKPTLVDAKPENLKYFKGCFAICPNIKEAEKMSKIKYNENKKLLEKIAKKISQENEIKNVLITCAEEGVFVYNSENRVQISSNAVKAVDPTGAGDTSIAGFSVGLVCGMDVLEATRFGNYAAGISVEKVGTSTVSFDEIIKKIKRRV